VMLGLMAELGQGRKRSTGMGGRVDRSRGRLVGADGGIGSHVGTSRWLRVKRRGSKGLRRGDLIGVRAGGLVVGFLELEQDVGLFFVFLREQSRTSEQAGGHSRHGRSSQESNGSLFYFRPLETSFS
jgi:hypothetical protein